MLTSFLANSALLVSSSFMPTQDQIHLVDILVWQKIQELKDEKQYESFSVDFVHFINVLEKNDYKLLNKNFGFQFKSNENKINFFKDFKENSTSFKKLSEKFSNKVSSLTSSPKLMMSRAILSKKELLELAIVIRKLEKEKADLDHKAGGLGIAAGALGIWSTILGALTAPAFGAGGWLSGAVSAGLGISAGAYAIKSSNLSSIISDLNFLKEKANDEVDESLANDLRDQIINKLKSLEYGYKHVFIDFFENSKTKPIFISNY